MARPKGTTNRTPVQLRAEAERLKRKAKLLEDLEKLKVKEPTTSSR